MDDAAERILKCADQELAALREAEQEAALREIMRELATWLEVTAAGRERPRPRAKAGRKRKPV